MNTMKKSNIFLVLIFSLLIFSSCKYDFILPEEVPVVNDVKFSTQIVPIFAQKCNLCHNEQTPVMSADLAYSQLVPSYVNLAEPSNSEIYKTPTSGTHGATISATQAALILQWITEGAKDN
jgi:hypothetical protein